MKLTKTSFNKIATHPLQTWEWGDFRSEWGNEVVRTPHGLLTLHRIPKTKYKAGAFIRGPRPTKKMLNYLKDLAGGLNLILIKLEPNVATGDKSLKYLVTKKEIDRERKLLSSEGSIKGKTLFTPTSFQIDLTKSEDDLMKSFTSKTRYNIRLAERKGVGVVEDNSTKAFDTYIELMRETVHHQRFYAHNEKYHRLMWKHLHTNMKKKPIARLLTAKYKNEILVTWIIFVWKDFLYYPYGARTTKHRNLMAPNLMMWEAVKYGKKNGLKVFDLWGRELGKGFTKFKEGYSPQVVEFIGTWDLKTSPLYWPYRGADMVRWGILRTKSKFTKPAF